MGAFGNVPLLHETRAKWAELVQLIQKLVPSIRIVIFGNERTRSTPLDPKVMFSVFRSVWVHWAMFRYYMKQSAKRAELVQLIQKFMP